MFKCNRFYTNVDNIIKVSQLGSDIRVQGKSVNHNLVTRNSSLPNQNKQIEIVIQSSDTVLGTFIGAFALLDPHI